MKNDGLSQIDYDVIVIGSGAGGLSAAVALAQAGLSVLVCEQHEVAGGWTHSFTMEGYRFSPGVHYIGALGKGQRLRRIYEGLGVSQDLEFLELNPDGYDRIYIGDERFDIPRGQEGYIARLKARFPHEANGIDRFFQAVLDINAMLDQFAAARVFIPRPSSLRWLFRTGADLINHYISDPLLRAILAGQAGDYGLPPSQAAAVIHAAMMYHYLDGSYFPRGGGGAIPRAFGRALKQAGGQLRLNTRVQRIILQGKRAVGVELVGGETLSARHIVSNADPEVTFYRLIGQEYLSRKLRRKLRTARYTSSALSLFLALDLDFKSLGFDSGNLWFYEHNDLEKIYADSLGDYVVHHPPGLIFATITTLKDPSKMHSGRHTMEAFTFVNYKPFAQWADDPSGDRDWEYQKLKKALTDKMLDTLDQRIPGLRDAVVFCELRTPLTNAHYINVHNGHIYGIKRDMWHVGPLGFSNRTEFSGLHLCGANTLAHGVAAVTETGLIAASNILGCRPDDLLSQNGPELRIYPCEDLSQWPEQLQQRAARGAHHR
jgi:phytoene dehydrogenase-like protein